MEFAPYIPYPYLYPVIALRSHGKFLDWWIFKSYKAGFKIPNVDYPENPYRFRQGGHSGLVVTKLYYPENPRTPEQQGWRSVFYDAVYNWRGFDDATKDFYNKLERPPHMVGINRYLRLYLNANYPMIIYWGPLQKSATEPTLIPDYIASDYFVRGFDISPISWDGWLQAKETWVFEAPDAFTVDGDVRAKYPKGTRIRLKQGGEYKYFSVIKSSIYGPGTVVEIIGGDDYSLAEADITDNFLSYVETPQGFPDWFNFTPTITGGESMTFTGVTVHYCQFKIVGKQCFMFVYASGTTGGTASKWLDCTLPVTTITLGAIAGAAPPSIAKINDGQSVLGRVYNFSGIHSYIGRFDGKEWGLGGGRSFKFGIWYEI